MFRMTLLMCLNLCPAVTPAADWIDLIGPNSDLAVWKEPGNAWQFAGAVGLDPKNPRRLRAEAGKGVLVNAGKGRVHDLVTRQSFDDIELHVEFLIPKGSNSGVKFHGVYEIQILDSWGKKDLTGDDCGGIYPRAELRPRYRYLDKGIAPRVNACRPPGEWQSLDAIFLAPRFEGGKKIANARLVKAVLNGKVIHDNVELKTPTGHLWQTPEAARGPLLLQGDHGPVAFRNLRLRPYAGHGQTVINSDFSKGDFVAQRWKVSGAWGLFNYPKETANNPGMVARFPAHKGNGKLTKTFAEIRNPKKLKLALAYGWGWGGVAQGADSVSWMLLDPNGNGYIFEVHRTKAKWAVQWGQVAGGSPANDRIWAREDIDATQPAVRDGGGLCPVTISRAADGSWSFSSKHWNKGAGAAVRFIDTTTTSFGQVVLLGTENFDEQVFNRIVLEAAPSDQPAATTAIPVADFLNSIGVVSTFPDRGQPLAKTIDMVKYGGFRWVRGGIEGLSDSGPTTLQTYLDLHRQTGIRFSWGLVSGGSDLKRLIETARPLAKAGALLAFEGNNEPNNWGVTYQGKQGAGRAPSWLAVAELQRDLYHAVKSDPLLKDYPVWSLSENGAEVDNVGLQFLTIPTGAGTLLPAGTKFADYANVHNYFYHPGSPGLMDNRTWNAADPTSLCKVDGLYGNYGVTWAKHFRGYSETELLSLPRVTTETGCTIGGPITEEIQALNLLSMYLDQFKRGWSYTAVYLLRDRTDEGGNQSFGFL